MTNAGPLFGKVLVANRGEIALRVMRSCKELGIATVAVYGPGEEDAPHARYADESFRIPSERPLPYLDIPALIAVAERAGVDAVHPGYGFLAENPDFARACAEAGVTFVGPSPEAIAAMGDKVEARRVAAEASVPMVPGTEEPVDLGEARAFAEEVGFPVAIKAAAGGGGRGFRVAWSADDLAQAFRGASGEAERYFGDGRVYVERYLDHPHHVEIQVFADTLGRTVSLGERDCSVQRRHQKLVEESPSPAIDAEIRARMGETAVALARAVGYVNAGTVEFLFQDGAFYFLEMNTRIQVEHPVTELVTGIDLVAEQLRVAAGLPLSFESVALVGHAIEVRINAEDPGRNFAPTPGTIAVYRQPSGLGIRVDGAAEPGYEIQPRYDSLIAKLIVWGRDREQALARMARALDDFQVEGVPTTIPFDRKLIASRAFRSGDFDTRLLERAPELLDLPPQSPPLQAADGARAEPEEYMVEVGGKRFEVRLFAPAGAPARAPRDSALPPRRAGSRAAEAATSGAVTSPLQGTVLSVAVTPGQHVAAGDLICVVEAMKMENEIKAPLAGVVSRVEVAAGQTVQHGALLAEIDSGAAAG